MDPGPERGLVWHDIQRGHAQRRVVCKRPVARPGAAVASTYKATCVVRNHEQGHDTIWNST
eukprot:8150127-Pyramimonas_sp.AAC.1